LPIFNVLYAAVQKKIVFLNYYYSVEAKILKILIKSNYHKLNVHTISSQNYQSAPKSINRNIINTSRDLSLFAPHKVIKYFRCTHLRSFALDINVIIYIAARNTHTFKRETYLYRQIQIELLLNRLDGNNRLTQPPYELNCHENDLL